MAVTIVVVTENVCMSKHWKAEQVTYGIRSISSLEFTLLIPSNRENPLTIFSVQKCSAPCSDFKTP